MRGGWPDVAGCMGGWRSEVCRRACEDAGSQRLAEARMDQAAVASGGNNGVGLGSGGGLLVIGRPRSWGCEWYTSGWCAENWRSTEDL